MSILSSQFAGYIGQLAIGTWVTVQLFMLGFVLAFVFGTLIGIASLSPNRVVQALWRTYASIIMGVPSLLVIFLIFYGGGAMLQAAFGRNGPELTPFGAGVASLTIVYAAYVAELVQGAVRNLPRGQFEATAALGIRPIWAWWYVILPQLFRLAFPGLVNVWMIVLKDTPLVSLAGLNELVANSKLAAGATKEPFVFFIAASLFFIVFSALTLQLSTVIEKRLQRGLAEVKA